MIKNNKKKVNCRTEITFDLLKHNSRTAVLSQCGPHETIMCLSSAECSCLNTWLNTFLRKNVCRLECSLLVILGETGLMNRKVTKIFIRSVALTFSEFKPTGLLSTFSQNLRAHLVCVPFVQEFKKCLQPSNFLRLFLHCLALSNKYFIFSRQPGNPPTPPNLLPASLNRWL